MVADEDASKLGDSLDGAPPAQVPVSQNPRRGSLPVKIDKVDELREQWLNAQHRAIDLAHKAAAMAAALELGSEGSAVASREVEAAQLEATAKQVAYQDAARRFDSQEAAAREASGDRLAATNTELAKSQTRIALAVATFTALQLILAFAQAMKWIK